MISHGLRSLWERKTKLVMSLTAIALASAFLTGSWLHVQALNTRMSDQAIGRLPDVVVASTGSLDPQRQDTKPATYSDADIDQVAKIPGVSAVEPQRTIAGADVTSTEDGSAMIGLNPGMLMAWSEFELSNDRPALRLIEGRSPQSGQVVLDPVTFEDSGHGLGDLITVGFPVGDQVQELSLELVGIGDWSAGSDSSQWIFLDPAQLDEIGGETTRSTLWVRLAAGADIEATTQAIRDGLPGSDALTAQQAGELTTDANDSLAFLGPLLAGFSMVAMLVAASLIVNTFSILVAQRTRELALLRALGASPGQLRGMVLAEGAVVGLIGSLLGAGIGWAGSAVVLRFTAPDAPAQIPDPPMIVAAVIIGVLITGLAALLPAQRASRIAPVVAMRGVTSAPRPATRRAGRWGTNLVPAPPAMGQLLGRLAVLNVRRAPGRTFATAATLTICLGLVSLLAVLGSSIKASIAVSIPEAMSADLLVMSSAPVSEELISKVRDAEQVSAVYSFESAGASIGEQQISLTATEASSIGTAINQTITQGRAAENPYELLVTSSRLASQGWRVGDEVPGVVAGTPVTWRIVGAFDYPPTVSMGEYWTDPSTLRELGLPEAPSMLAIHAAPDTDIATLKDDISRILRQLPGAKLLDAAEFNAFTGEYVDSLLRMLNGLSALAAVIAALGIVNTVGLAVSERTRELGMLRAVGMARSQVWLMVVQEALLVGLLGGLTGVLGGVLLGAGLRASNSAEMLVLDIPWLDLGVLLAASLVIGLVASLVPAWNAARTPVLTAVADQDA